MKTKSLFLDPKRVLVELENGDRYILGFLSTMNYQIEQRYDNLCTRCIDELFNNYYSGDEKSIWGPIVLGMYKNQLNPFSWVVNDRDRERERIGRRIKDIRKELGLEAKELAKRVGIDPGNLSRIEQGRFSVGVDILGRIAGALNMELDFVAKVRIESRRENILKG